MESKKFERWKKVGKGALIAMAGALATYLTDLKVDFGDWTPAAVVIFSVAVNAIRLWIRDNS